MQSDYVIDRVKLDCITEEKDLWVMISEGWKWEKQCSEAVSRDNKQVAQLSQRDRAAGWVSYGQKWKTGTGRKYLRTI